MSVRPSPLLSLLRIPEPSLPSVSPSAQPDGRSPGKENERYSGAFGESCKVRAPPAHPDSAPRAASMGTGGLNPKPSGVRSLSSLS